MRHCLQIVLPPQETLDPRKPEISMNLFEKKRKQTKGIETAQSVLGPDTLMQRNKEEPEGLG